MVTKIHYRDCEIERIYPPIPGTFYEWHRPGYEDLDSPWMGVDNSVDGCMSEIDDVYAENDDES